MRQCCGPGRGFVMHITDNLNQVSSFHVLPYSSYFTSSTPNLSDVTLLWQLFVNELLDFATFYLKQTTCLYLALSCADVSIVLELYLKKLQEVIRIVRDFKCSAGCCWCAAYDCCQMDVSIEAPVGQVVGYVRQQ